MLRSWALVSDSDEDICTAGGAAAEGAVSGRLVASEVGPSKGVDDCRWMEATSVAPGALAAWGVGEAGAAGNR